MASSGRLHRGRIHEDIADRALRSMIDGGQAHDAVAAGGLGIDVDPDRVSRTRVNVGADRACCILGGQADDEDLLGAVTPWGSERGGHDDYDHGPHHVAEVGEQDHVSAQVTASLWRTSCSPSDVAPGHRPWYRQGPSGGRRPPPRNDASTARPLRLRGRRAGRPSSMTSPTSARRDGVEASGWGRNGRAADLAVRCDPPSRSPLRSPATHNYVAREHPRCRAATSITLPSRRRATDAGRLARTPGASGGRQRALPPGSPARSPRRGRKLGAMASPVIGA